MAELSFRLVLITDDASGKIAGVKSAADDLKQAVEAPKEMKLSAEQALGTIRDVKIAIDGVMQIFSGLASGMNNLLDAALGQRQAMTLAGIAFGEAASEMANFASSMQQVTNFEDDQLLALMSKLGQTFKLNKDEIKELTPMLLDFTEANKITGMTVESAFDLMGRALNGHTEMLGRYGIELDTTRLQQEGVSYLVEKLGEDYGGTAVALADLRTQNANAWGDIQETVGDMLQTLINPLLQGIQWLMQAFNSLSPIMKGVVAGLLIAVPVFAAVSTAITTMTVAVHALRTAMNPVAGIIGIAVGALSALGLGIAAASQSTGEMAEETKSMNDQIKDAEDAVNSELEKFNMLSTRLLALRSATNLTKTDKQELKNVIKSLNDSYGSYLKNIDLETSGYNNLAAALQKVGERLVQKKVAEIYGETYNAQLKQVAELQVAFERLKPELDRLQARKQQLMASVDWEYMTSDANPMGFNPSTYFGNDDEWGKLEKRITQIQGVSRNLRAAQAELLEIQNAYRNAMLNAGDLIFDYDQGGGGGTGGGGGESEDERQKREAERLIGELAALRQNETKQIEAEYKRRLGIIQKYTKDGSAEEMQAISDLDAWKTDELKKIGTREKAAIQASFQDQISYYSNLESLGVSSYDALKKTMEEYYAWAKENLPKAEADLVLAQMQEANLRWGKHRQEKIDAEIAHQNELADIRFEFGQTDLEQAGRGYQAQLDALEKYYRDKHAKLIEAGLTEQQIEKQKLAAIRELEEQSLLAMGNGLSKTLGMLMDAVGKESKKAFAIWKAMAIAQGMIDTLSSAIAAYRSMVGVPVIGPGLAVVAAAAALAAGIANVAKISAMKYEPPKAATGGMLKGAPHSQGGVLIEAEGDEYITAKDRVKALGRGIFDFLNFAPLNAVRQAFAGFQLPLAAADAGADIDGGGSYSFARGGRVTGGGGSNALMGIMESIDEKMGKLIDKRIGFDIHIDPLDANPVKISELADTGKQMRSEL